MKIEIPLLRTIDPRVLAQELTGVQPMTMGGHAFSLRYIESSKLPKPIQGAWRHDFLFGNQRYYGTQWIAEQVWVKIKIKGL